jgi:hypothetical protein
MKTLKFFALCILLIATLSPTVALSRGNVGTYSSYTASYLQQAQSYRSLANYYAMYDGSGTFDYYTYYNLYYTSYYTNAASTYANYEYTYEDSGTNCYYAKVYAGYASTYASSASTYAYYKYLYGSSYASYVESNNKSADFYTSYANYYNFYCG